MKSTSWILTFIFFATLQSCNYKTNKLTDAGNTVLTTPETLISYSLIKNNTTAVCLNCHVPGDERPDLSTKQGLIDNMTDVLADVKNDDMPDSGTPLTVCQKAVLQKWYDLGSPDDSTMTIKTLPECITEINP